MKPAIIALAGPDLTQPEADLLEAYPPAGVILFKRNIDTPTRLAGLVGDLRERLPPEAVLMVDHEGGRVARLGPPNWRAHPAAGAIGTLYAQAPEDARRLAWLTGALIGLDCKDAGFDVVCAPVLDVGTPTTTHAIGDRAYGFDPVAVAILGQAMADGLLAAGIQPVAKHAPGHGHAAQDTHEALPHVSAATDLTPEISVFQVCASLPWMMTAHILYMAIDPTLPGTLSPIVINDVIRGTIGFDGVLVSDDLAMGALSGPAAARATAAIAAGCDLALHCSGQLDETATLLAALPNISAHALQRLARARKTAARFHFQLDRRMLEADQDALTGW